MSDVKEVKEESPSIEETMSDLFDEIAVREEPEKEERPRAADGKFAKKEEPEPEKKEESPPEAEKQVTDEKIGKVEKAESIRPPSSWSAAAKTKFATLDPDVQKEVLKREEDFHRGIEQYKSKASFADNLYREIAPYEAMLRSEGVSPDVAIKNLLSAAYTLRTGTPQQKSQLIQYVVQNYGIDLSGLTTEQEFVDPNTTALQQRLQQLESVITSQYQQNQTQETQALSSEIETFKVDPANLYFDDVREDMAALLQAGRAKGLKEAYEMAVWARPDIRQQLLLKQQRDEEAKRVEEAKKTAIQAKKSSSVNVRSRTGVFQPKNESAGNSINDTMSAIFDEIQSRDAH